MRFNTKLFQLIDFMKTIFIVLNVDKYGTPEVVDYFLSEEEAKDSVASLKDLGYDQSCYELMCLNKLTIE